MAANSLGVRMSTNTYKAIVKTIDMSEEMEKDAIEFSTQALNDYMVESQMASYIKREFDKKYK